jgi:uncharacterized membrane protein YphA (DoxX/SURF4 family)
MNLDSILHPSLAALILRLFIGGLLATHGYPKLTKGKKQGMDWMGSMGMPKALAPLIGILELVGGIFLVVGFLTSLVSILFALEFAGICVQGKKMGKKSLGDYEKDLLFLGGALAMLFLGAGSLSLDRLLGI